MQRILLEVVYEATENAGIPISSLAGSDTGCYVGCFTSDYDQIAKRDPETLPKYHAVGTGQAILSNRISYCFDLKGPSVTLDTACSSSLVAIHLACQSLRLGESRAAIVGATHAILNPDVMVGMTNLHFLSPDSICHTFDDRANGYSRGEGMAALVLKPLDAAIADGDTIRAVIRGTAVNSNGRNHGITLPSRDAQVQLIKSAYAQAGCDPAETGYCECHGTGTAAGDPIETGAIGDALGIHRSDGEDAKLYVGSVKTNIGHLEGASGLAGLIKAVMSVEKGLIAPNLWFKNGNPKIDFDAWKIRVPTEVVPWPTLGLRRASINGFGYGGTNAHIIIDDAYHYMAQRGLSGKHCTELPQIIEEAPQLGWETPETRTATPTETDVESLSSKSSVVSEPQSEPCPQVFFFSGKEKQAVTESMKRCAEYLALEESGSEQFLRSLAHTLSEKRSRFGYGASVVARTKDNLIARLLEENEVNSTSQNLNIAFVFTGQGAQWWAMGRELLKYPVFCASISASAEAVERFGADWNLMEELLKSQKASRINEAEISQPLCTAVQVALVDLFASWDIFPSRVVGHSSGEIAAAYATGALSTQSAMCAAYYRGVLSSKISTLGYKGGMLAAGLSEVEALEEISYLPESAGKVVVACVNSPRSVTLSGDGKAILEMRKILTSKGFFARKLQVETAYHSHHMLALAEEYRLCLEKLDVNPWSQRNSVTMFSSVKARAIGENDDLSGDYWVDNMVSCVRFSDAVTELCSDKSIDTLIEIGPHSALAGPVKQIVSVIDGAKVTYLSALLRNQDAAETTLKTAAGLFDNSQGSRISKLNGKSSEDLPTLVNLPSYPWNHEKSYWAESRLSKDYRFRPGPRTDILGAPFMDWNPLEPRWRNFIRISEQPWVRSHVVQGALVYPAAGYCCMALEAASQLEKMEQCRTIKAFKITDLSISRALVIPDTEDGVEVTFSMRNNWDNDDRKEFRVFSHATDNGWAEHCHGSISVMFEDVEKEGMPLPESLINVPSKELYSGLEYAGLFYGPEFQGIQTLQSTAGFARGTIEVTDTASSMPYGFEFDRIIHPATMDTFLQMSIAAFVGSDINQLRNPYVPTDVKEIVVSGGILLATGNKLEISAEAQASGRTAIGNILAETDEGSFVSMKGIKLVAIASGTGDQAEDATKHCATAVWEPEADLLTVDQANSLLREATEGTAGRQRLRDMELIAYYYFDKVMKEIEEKDVPKMLPHHQKFFHYMKHQKSLVEAGAHEQQTPDWLQLNSPEVQERIQKQIQELANPQDYEGEMFVRMGEALPSILRREIDPLQLMLKDNLLYNYYTVSLGTKGTYPQIAKYVSMLSHKNPDLEYLEIGAGTGGCSLPVLEALSGTEQRQYKRLRSYTYTDISAGFFEQAAEKFSAWSDVIEFSKLDIEQDPSTQAGFETRKFDVIIAANVLHATFNMHKTMGHVRQLLKPGGKLVLLDMTHSVLSVSLVFGNLSGWWNCSEEWRTLGPLLDESQWRSLLTETGFSDLTVSSADCLDKLEEQTRVIVASAVEQDEIKICPPVVIVKGTDSEGSEQSQIVQSLSKYLDNAKITAAICSIDQPLPTKGAVVVSLAELDSPILADISDSQYQTLQNFIQQSEGLIWVTRGATTGGKPELALFQGMARSLRAEREGVACVSIDFDDQSVLQSDKSAELVFKIIQKKYLERSLLDQEFYEQSGILHIKRAVENTRLDNTVAARANGFRPISQLKDFSRISAPLELRDGLFEEVEHLEIVEGAVNVAVKAIHMQGQAIGFAGVVDSLGAAVENFKVGDRVHGFCLKNPSTSIQCAARTVQKFPDSVSFAVAASLPLTHIAAYFAFNYLSNLRRGQSVLIIYRSKNGDAAIEMAIFKGAKVFIVADDIEAVCSTHNIDRRQVFQHIQGAKEAICHETSSRGVDVVFDEADSILPLTTILAPLGHYIKASSGAIPNEYLLQNRSVSSLDTCSILKHDTKLAADIFSNLCTFVWSELNSQRMAVEAMPLSALVSPDHSTDSVYEIRSGDLVPVSDNHLMSLEMMY